MVKALCLLFLLSPVFYCATFLIGRIRAFARLALCPSVLPVRREGLEETKLV